MLNMESLCQSKMNVTQNLRLFDLELRLQGHIGDFFDCDLFLSCHIGDHLKSTPSEIICQIWNLLAKNERRVRIMSKTLLTDGWTNTDKQGSGPISIYFDLLLIKVISVILNLCCHLHNIRKHCANYENHRSKNEREVSFMSHHNFLRYI